MIRVSDGEVDVEGGGDLGSSGVEVGYGDRIYGEGGDAWAQDQPHDEEDGAEDDEDGYEGGKEPPEEGGARRLVLRRVVWVVVWVVVVGVRWGLLWVPVLGLSRVARGGASRVGHRRWVGAELRCQIEKPIPTAVGQEDQEELGSRL